tara:strand:+ start:76 stop:318 length:243 start_codon:yes stop_codon:yes gene_type:complete
MKIVIQYGPDLRAEGLKIVEGLRELVGIDDPDGLWDTPVKEKGKFRILLNNVEYLRFQKDVLERFPTAQEIADYIKDAGD